MFFIPNMRKSRIFIYLLAITLIIIGAVVIVKIFKTKKYSNTILYEIEMDEDKPAGIINFNVNCFLNTALQLLNLDELYDYLSNKSLINGSLSKILYNLLRKIRLNKEEVSIKYEYKDFMTKLNKKFFKLNDLNATDELIAHTLNILFEEEINKHNSNDNDVNNLDSGEIIDLNNLSLETHDNLIKNSKIYKLFGTSGLLELKDKVITEFYISVPILPSLQENINKYCRNERENFQTEIRNDFLIIKIPEILFINCPSLEGLFSKFNLLNHLKITFMNEEYELQGISLLIPGTNIFSIGHYFAIIKKANKFYKTNDSCVNRFFPHEANESTRETVSCLIYKRIKRKQKDH
ncbi:hypothetical protein H312_02421 [Anncaliia algerae PRA339]|uniref:USP domain-containing protein n=1 Tax=Anncaliia algerae PRA339 TaxID=1288291 RepID=A0A059EZ36_9MICR|nr:hypothetical protein H312_02421 [Anncaliia algerae PRA339]